MKLEWVSTEAHPKTPGSGVTGWKLHAVYMNDSFKEVRFKAAVCGQKAKYGWTLDLFIEYKCKRCLMKLNKRC